MCLKLSTLAVNLSQISRIFFDVGGILHNLKDWMPKTLVFASRFARGVRSFRTLCEWLSG